MPVKLGLLPPDRADACSGRRFAPPVLRRCLPATGGAGSPSADPVIALGLLPPYRLDVASDPAWMATFARHADEVGLRVAPRRRARGRARSATRAATRTATPAACRCPRTASCPTRSTCWPGWPPAPSGSGSAPASSCSRSTTRSSSPSAAPRSTGCPAGACSSASASAGCARRSRRSASIPDERGSRTDEAIDALRVIWQRGRADRSTASTSRFGPVRSHPKPVQPTIPILVGGHSPRGRPPGRASAATASSRSACPATRSTSAGRRCRPFAEADAAATRRPSALTWAASSATTTRHHRRRDRARAPTRRRRSSHARRADLDELRLTRHGRRRRATVRRRLVTALARPMLASWRRLAGRRR